MPGTISISSIVSRLGLGSVSSADGITEILVYTTDDSVTQGRRCCSPDPCGRTARVERRRGLLK